MNNPQHQNESRRLQEDVIEAARRLARESDKLSQLIGFALLLAAIFAMRSGNTSSVSWHEGLTWGLAGFAVFTIASGLGLPPELPGVPAAALLSRQRPIC